MQGRQLTTDKILVRSGHLIGLTSATRCLETSELQMYLLVTVKHAQNAKNWQSAYSTRVCVYSQEHETGPGTRLKRYQRPQASTTRSWTRSWCRRARPPS